MTYKVSREVRKSLWFSVAYFHKHQKKFVKSIWNVFPYWHLFWKWPSFKICDRFNSDIKQLSLISTKKMIHLQVHFCLVFRFANLDTRMNYLWAINMIYCFVFMFHCPSPHLFSMNKKEEMMMIAVIIKM